MVDGEGADKPLCQASVTTAAPPRSGGNAEVSEQLYQKIVEHSHDGIVLMGSHGLIVDFNPAAERMFGYRRDEVVGQLLTCLMPERYRTAHSKGLARFLTTGEAKVQGKVLQLEGLKQDGTEFPIELTVSAYRAGSEWIFTGILRDVTERKRAATVAESLAHVGRLVIQSLDLQLVGQQIAQSLCALLGTQSSILFQSEPQSGDLLPLAVSADVLPAHGKDLVLPAGTGVAGLAARQHCPVVTADVLLDDRILLPAEARASIAQASDRAVLAVPLLVRGRVIGALSTRDSAGRVFGDQEIRLAEAFADYAAIALENARLYKEVTDARDFLQSITEHSADAIVTTDLHGRVTYFSPGAEELSGYRADEVLGRPVAELYRYGREEAQALMQRLHAEGRIRNYETAVRTQDGRLAAASVSISLLRDTHGELVGTVGVGKDLTERKQAEDKLRESEAGFRLLFASNPHPMWVYDLETLQFLEVNDAAIARYGYSRTEFLAMRITDIRPLEDVGRLLDDLRTPRPAFQAAREWRHQTRDGRILDVDITSHTLTFAGRAAALVVAQDITERERAQAELQASEHRYRLLAENVTDVIWVRDMTLQATYISPSVTRLRGYSVEEAMAQTIDQTLTPASREIALKALTRALSEAGTAAGADPSQSVTLRLEATRKGGSTIWTETTMSFLRNENNEPVAMLGVSRDITERRRAEEALRESEERFRGAFEGSSIGMALQGLDGHYLRVNRALCKMLGYAEPELLSMTYQAITHPDEPGRDAAYEQDMLEGRIGSYEREKRFLHKRGQAVWVLVTISLVRDRDAQPLYFVVQVQDMTERKQAAEAQAQLENQLRQAQKMEAVGRLAGGVAHDFNNLLTVIRGRAQLLRERLSPDDPIRRQIEIVERTADRAARLTQQLLAFSRKQVLKPKVLDLNEVIAAAGDLLSRLIGEDITLVAERGPLLGRVRADPTQLEQVIVNLAVNARDAMPHGGRLIFRTANAELDQQAVRTLPGLRPGRYVALQVEDTGHGMDAKTQARIFEPFFTTKGPGKGTGLGLATVYGIVKQSGGGIYVDSEVGRGTTFTIYLPRVDPAEEVRPEETAPPATPSGAETVLLVEDDDDVRELAREILETYGYRVLAVSDPILALRTAESHQEPIHLLLTDVIMPNMSGRALADQLMRTRPHLKVLYMSGYTDDAIVHHGVLEPGTNLLPKPFTPEAVAGRVREVLDG